MNQTMHINQANQFLGNNVMNPQQQQQRWMTKPTGDPSGLAYLKPLESLFVNQVVSMSEFITGIPAQAKYGVFNDQREQVYFAFEESDVCQRMCCPKTRRFDLHIVDSANQSNWHISLFFLAYLIFAIPSNILMRYLGATRHLSLSMLAWGSITVGLAFIHHDESTNRRNDFICIGIVAASLVLVIILRICLMLENRWRDNLSQEKYARLAAIKEPCDWHPQVRYVL
ncbi:unnamed protein product [Rotaria sordida]|uniref:Phospholipid scramblase n=1 Tax=Rotaria sordida TaxID=392033 RepID=A0A815ALU9_9BILA|nr:unnamed protein product [Rotaria sordida]